MEAKVSFENSKKVREANPEGATPSWLTMIMNHYLFEVDRNLAIEIREYRRLKDSPDLKSIVSSWNTISSISMLINPYIKRIESIESLLMPTLEVGIDNWIVKGGDWKLNSRINALNNCVRNIRSDLKPLRSDPDYYFAVIEIEKLYQEIKERKNWETVMGDF